jgi:hypothetical protein
MLVLYGERRKYRGITRGMDYVFTRDSFVQRKCDMTVTREITLIKRNLVIKTKRIMN